jgi:WD40 repeat protein
MTPQFEHLLPHEGAVLLLRTTPNHIVASSQKGGTTVIERILDRDEKTERYTHQSTLELGKLWDTACLGDHLVVANDDAVVRLWSLTTKSSILLHHSWIEADILHRESIRAFHGHESAARAVHLPDERTIVSSDKTGVIRIWDLPSGECRHVLNDHEGDVLPGALASHGELLISGGYDNRVRIWNMISGKCLHVLEHDGVVGIFGWIKDHTHIAAGAIGGPIKIWRISDG